MPIESTYSGIWSLNEDWPLPEEFQYTWDDHIRGIKASIKNSFPAVKGAVLATQENLNFLQEQAEILTLVKVGDMLLPVFIMAANSSALFVLNVPAARVGDIPFVQFRRIGGLQNDHFVYYPYIVNNAQVRILAVNPTLVDIHHGSSANPVQANIALIRRNML